MVLPAVSRPPGADREAFGLLQFTVDGKERTIRRTQRKGAQSYTVSVAAAGKDHHAVTVSYTYKVLVRKHGHLLRLGIAKPTKGLRIELRYGECDIDYVNVVGFIASSQPTRMSRSPEEVSSRSVELAFDGWVFPQSSVAFV